MEMCIQDNGKMIKPMERAFIYTKMGQNIQEIGSKICSTVLDVKSGLMGHHIKGMLFIYCRHYQNGTKNGEGRFVWKNGDVYEGNFQENMIQGSGKMTFRDGKTYEGEWKDNKMNGTGIFIWPDGRRYEGEFVNDKKNGYGRL